MHDALKPVVRQLDETYDALRISLGQMSDEQLGWRPADGVDSVAQIVQHIADGNLTYANVIGPENWPVPDDRPPTLPRDLLLHRMDESRRIAVAAIEGVTAANLADSRADSWCPNCDEQEIQGPLDAQWFAQQMVRHTAYHLGQINLYLLLLEA